MTGTDYHFDVGRARGRRLRRAIEHNLEAFWSAVDRRGIERDEVREAASRRASASPDWVVAELRGKAAGTGLPFQDLLAFDSFEETLQSDGCTVAIAAGAAAESGDTVFFKQSDKKGADEFEGDDYHQHQQINVIRVIEPETEDANRILAVTAAGSTAVKMGINERGVAIGSNISRTVTFDEEGSDSRDWAAASRGAYMREGLHHGDTAVEVAQHITPKLYADPMSSPGNIDIADADRAIVIEGEFTHLASEWVRDDVVGRANKFEVLDDLARPDEQIPSSYRRYERVMTALEGAAGAVDVETMRDLSVDHENGPGLESICRHQENDYADETSLSAAIFDIDGDDPAASDVFIALGKPCHAWRSEKGEGWVHLTAGATEADVAEPFLSGEAWLDHYTEEPYAGDRTVAPLD